MLPAHVILAAVAVLMVFMPSVTFTCLAWTEKFLPSLSCCTDASDDFFLGLEGMVVGEKKNLVSKKNPVLFWCAFVQFILLCFLFARLSDDVSDFTCLVRIAFSK